MIEKQKSDKFYNTIGKNLRKCILPPFAIRTTIASTSSGRGPHTYLPVGIVFLSLSAFQRAIIRHHQTA